MADIAMVFHWPPAAMADMDIDELADWHEKAVERLKLLHPPRSPET